MSLGRMKEKKKHPTNTKPNTTNSNHNNHNNHNKWKEHSEEVEHLTPDLMTPLLFKVNAENEILEFLTEAGGEKYVDNFLKNQWTSVEDIKTFMTKKILKSLVCELDSSSKQKTKWRK